MLLAWFLRQDLTMVSRLSSNSQSTCFSFLRVTITGLCYNIQTTLSLDTFIFSHAMRYRTQLLQNLDTLAKYWKQTQCSSTINCSTSKQYEGWRDGSAVESSQYPHDSSHGLQFQFQGKSNTLSGLPGHCIHMVHNLWKLVFYLYMGSKIRWSGVVATAFTWWAILLSPLFILRQDIM